MITSQLRDSGLAPVQGHELRIYDAYALYMLMCFIQPKKDEWKEFRIRVTKTMIDGLIQKGDLRQPKMVYVSDVFDLAFWDADAWSTFLLWQTSS